MVFNLQFINSLLSMQNSDINNKDVNNGGSGVDGSDAILSTDFYQLTMAGSVLL